MNNLVAPHGRKTPHHSYSNMDFKRLGRSVCVFFFNLHSAILITIGSLFNRVVVHWNCVLIWLILLGWQHGICRIPTSLARNKFKSLGMKNLFVQNSRISFSHWSLATECWSTSNSVTLELDTKLSCLEVQVNWSCGATLWMIMAFSRSGCLAWKYFGFDDITV